MHTAWGVHRPQTPFDQPVAGRAVRALPDWLNDAGIRGGPVFRRIGRVPAHGAPCRLADGSGVPIARTLTGGNRNDVTQLLDLLDRVPPVRGRALGSGASTWRRTAR